MRKYYQYNVHLVNNVATYTEPSNVYFIQYRLIRRDQVSLDFQTKKSSKSPANLKSLKIAQKNFSLTVFRIKQFSSVSKTLVFEKQKSCIYNIYDTPKRFQCGRTMKSVQVLYIELPLYRPLYWDDIPTERQWVGGTKKFYEIFVSSRTGFV